jgi:hypothetical protein
MKLFVVRDTKAQYYHAPQTYRNSGDAIRACKNAVNDSTSGMFAKNAEDFSLFQVGEWDELTGAITPSEKIHVTDLVDLKEDTVNTK